jgi:hypothetical protein
METGSVRIDCGGSLHGMRGQHERVWGQILVQSEIVVEKKIEEVAAIIGLALGEE